MKLDIEALSPQLNRVRLDGRLDTGGVGLVETRFNAAVIASNQHALVDLAAVSFVSSMGIRMLITAAKAMHQRQRKLVLFAPQPLVRETLTTMAVDTVMALVDNEADARALVPAA